MHVRPGSSSEPSSNLPSSPNISRQVSPGSSSESSSRDESASRVFKRYKLSDAKTFDSLFFDDKKRLLAQVEHFTAKTGKYAVGGYPHKARPLAIQITRAPLEPFKAARPLRPF